MAAENDTAPLLDGPSSPGAAEAPADPELEMRQALQTTGLCGLRLPCAGPRTTRPKFYTFVRQTTGRAACDEEEEAGEKEQEQS